MKAISLLAWAGIGALLIYQGISNVELNLDNIVPKQEAHRSHPRLIHDDTLPWNTTMRRHWLDYQHSDGGTQPSSMLLLTSFGWNQPNQTKGLEYARSLGERKLYTTIVNHPLFHPTAWEDISSGAMPVLENVNYYVFLDLHSMRNLNYPHYAGGYEKNQDHLFNRTGILTKYVMCHEKGLHMPDAVLFRETKKSSTTNATLILFDGRGWGGCSSEKKKGRKKERGLPTSIASRSALLSTTDEDQDQGLIPPPMNTIQLSSQEEEDIRSCRADDQQLSSREFNVVYIGNFRSGINKEFKWKWGGARRSYEKLHDPSKGYIFQSGEKPKPMANGTNQELSYGGVIRRTKFGIAARGDDKFSFRFTEVMSAGAIPVYHGDDFQFPFRPELVDWNKCAVILPEKDAGQTTLDYIKQISPEKACAMRNYCYFEIYKKYIDAPLAPIDGLIKGLDLLAQGIRKPRAGIRCNATSIESLECNPR